MDQARLQWPEVRQNFIGYAMEIHHLLWGPVINQLQWPTLQLYPPNAPPQYSNSFRLLGHGSFGSVLSATLPFGSYAIKIIRYNGTPLPEMDLITLIPQHPTILPYYGWFRHGGYIIIGMKLCHGNLLQYLASNHYRHLNALNQRYMRWYIVHQVAEALHQLHSRGLMHRDIKPENILYLLDPQLPWPSVSFMIADFGIARLVPIQGNGTIQVGSPGYMAPEVTYNGQYNERVDIFSLGRIMNTIDAMSTSYSPPANSEWRRLLNDMTAYIPNNRPSASTVRDIAAKAMQNGWD